MHLRRYPGRAIRRLRRPPQALRVVVKGRLTVAEPSGPPPHSPILNVSYNPTPSTRNQGPGLVGIGHFMVAWQHEPEAEVNVVLSCVQRYANAAATPRVGDLDPTLAGTRCTTAWIGVDSARTRARATITALWRPTAMWSEAFC